MNNVKKPNDWFIAQIDNPSFTPGNFRDVGLTADNTGLLDRNTYKNSKYVQDKFKDDEGKFDEVSLIKYMMPPLKLIKSLLMMSLRKVLWMMLIGILILS